MGEDEGTVLIPVTLSQIHDQDITLHYSVHDNSSSKPLKGSAQSGDYIPPSGQITLPAGARTGHISLDIRDDGDK